MTFSRNSLIKLLFSTFNNYFLCITERYNIVTTLF